MPITLSSGNKDIIIIIIIEEKSFENVEDGRKTDAYLYYKLTYEPSAQMS